MSEQENASLEQGVKSVWLGYLELKKEEVSKCEEITASKEILVSYL